MGQRLVRRHLDGAAERGDRCDADDRHGAARLARPVQPGSACGLTERATRRATSSPPGTPRICRPKARSGVSQTSVTRPRPRRTPRHRAHRHLARAAAAGVRARERRRGLAQQHAGAVAAGPGDDDGRRRGRVGDVGLHARAPALAAPAAATRAATGRSRPRRPRRRRPGVHRPRADSRAHAVGGADAPAHGRAVEAQLRDAGAREAADRLARGVEGVHRDDRHLGRKAHQRQALLPHRRSARGSSSLARIGRIGRGLGREARHEHPVRRTPGMSRATAAATTGRQRLGRPGGQATRAITAPVAIDPGHPRARRIAGHRGGHDQRSSPGPARAWGTGCPSARLGDRPVPGRARPSRHHTTPRDVRRPVILPA